MRKHLDACRDGWLKLAELTLESQLPPLSTTVQPIVFITRHTIPLNALFVKQNVINVRYLAARKVMIKGERLLPSSDYRFVCEGLLRSISVNHVCQQWQALAAI